VVVVVMVAAAAAAGTSKNAEYAMYKRPRYLRYTCEISFHISVLRRFVFLMDYY
jgi:hypothetical protein